MLNVFTSLINYSGPDRLDITRGSGSGAGLIFAPAWGLLRPVIDARRIYGSIPPEVWQTYVTGYKKLMEQNEKIHRATWAELLARERVVLCCYCRDTVFCHRRVLANLLVHRGAMDHGEISPQWRPIA